MRTNPFRSIYDKCNSGNSLTKLQGLPEFPRYVDVELTNTCNFKCLMCPTGVVSLQRKKGFMSDEIFFKIINEIRARKTPLRFIRWGEPTLHPKLIDYLRISSENGILTHINTNGKLLDQDIIQRFVELPLASIKFSFQGVNGRSYRQMRNNDFFDELLRVIERLYKARGDREFPFIHVATTITYESLEQVESFQYELGKIADLVTVGRTQLDFIDLEKADLTETEIETLTWLKKQESLTKIHTECPEVFDKLSINWDGKVSACCSDYDEKMIVGNLLESTIQDIWNSAKLGIYRKLLADMRHDELELCRNCYDTMGIQVRQNKL